jgi:hypothetical protein
MRKLIAAMKLSVDGKSEGRVARASGVRVECIRAEHSALRSLDVDGLGTVAADHRSAQHCSGDGTETGAGRLRMSYAISKERCS